MNVRVNVLCAEKRFETFTPEYAFISGLALPFNLHLLGQVGIFIIKAKGILSEQGSASNYQEQS